MPAKSRVEGIHFRSHKECIPDGWRGWAKSHVTGPNHPKKRPIRRALGRDKALVWPSRAVLLWCCHTYSAISLKVYQSFHRNSNKRCTLKWTNNHLVTHSRFVKLTWLAAEGMFEFKARAYVDTIGVILFSYGCMQHWNLWFRDTSYMAIYGMVFPVRMFQIILHPHISSVLSVTLY